MWHWFEPQSNQNLNTEIKIMSNIYPKSSMGRMKNIQYEEPTLVRDECC